MNINNSWLGVYNSNPKKGTLENGLKPNKVEPSNFKSMVVGNEAKSDQQNAPIRVDKIELSSNVPSTSSTFDMAKLKEKLMADISKDTEALKIEAIKNQVNSNTYKVDATELAHILLQG